MKSRSLVIVAVGVVAVVVLATAAGAQRARRERPGHGKELQQIEQQIRAGRSVTRRVQRDPRASTELKQQATQLDALLDAREKSLAKLDAQYRNFLSQHQADLSELETLRKRALEIDGKLDQARTALVQANRPDLDELKRNSQQARELAETLRGSYETDRRTRRVK
jgi:hypothetical protein